MKRTNVIMKKHNTSLFLAQSYRDTWDDYNNSLMRENYPCWDYIVLTASNEAQANSYDEQIKHRIAMGALPSRTKYAVVPDPDNKRCGSGGATLAVLRYIAEQEENCDLSKLKILCIHSGGDSKRVPQYSACGKIFSPVPRMLPNGRRSTLFDEFVIGMSGIPARISSGLLVCSGDVLLLFNSLQLDFFGEGAAALSIKENVQTGKNHGVFLGGADGNVKRCLQKQSIETLTECGAVDKNNNVDIDTGAVILSGKIVNALYSLVDTEEKFKRMVNDHVRLSFYADFLYPLASDSTLESFYKEIPEGDFSPELEAARTLVWKALHSFNMKLVRFSPASFLHFGTTNQLLNLMTVDMPSYRFLGWSGVVNSNYHGNEFSVYNSYISKKAIIGKNSYIEDSDIHKNVKIGERCVISGVTLEDVEIPSNVVLHGLKLSGEKYVCRMYGVEDNPKKNIWLGKELDESLWIKPLFKVCSSMEAAVTATLQGDMSGEIVSLCDSFNAADVTAILPWQDKLDDKIIAESIIEAIDNRTPADELAELFPDGVSGRVEQYLLNKAQKLDENTLEDFSRKIRIYYYASKLADKEKMANLCFSTVCSSILSASINNMKYDSDHRIMKNEVTVRLPVRVNFGGGWSDTPPHSLENGGTVLNAAISLNGELPIEVTLKKLSDKKIILASTDIGSYKEFESVEELQDCTDPSDAFALHKAALIACGVIPYKDNILLNEVCDNLGGGFYMNTCVINIPKGSGLGTSSILAGACVKGIFEFLGVDIEDNELYGRVLCMEQLMSTGGGWQDQVGGIVPGIKMVTTAPGLEQKVVCTPLKLIDNVKNELGERFALIYTGQRRLARNLLREVVGKYIGSNPTALRVLNKIQQIAVLMRFELERGNVDNFAKLLSEHWELSKELDLGCTNTCIDQIFLAIDDLIDGRMICGAGGGGFLQVVMKKGVTPEMLEERLNEVFADSGVAVYRCAFV